MTLSIPLICPTCKDMLNISDMSGSCNTCHSTYPVRDGVFCFLESRDSFYEGAYIATTNITFTDDRKSLKARLFFDCYRDPYFRALRNYLQQGQTILDIGCGGGIRYLAQKGDVTGLDLSHLSLSRVAGFYKNAVQADALNMPFPDNTFDVITSAYNFEHFPPETKDSLLAQIYRVLKPGGKLIFLFDCDNNNAMFRYFKSNKELYQQCIIETDKHYGLELASRNLERFSKTGFSIVEYFGLNKTICQYLPVFGWLTPYGSRSVMVRHLTKISSIISKYRPLWMGYTAFVSWLDMLMSKIMPLNNSRVLLVVANKPIQ